MAVTVFVLYPYGAKFDMKYYLEHHMPLVLEKWSPFGLQRYEVVNFTNGLQGLDLDQTKTPYGTVAILHWHDTEGMAQGVKSEPESKVFADVPNFSDKSPIFIAGDVAGTSSK